MGLDFRNLLHCLEVLLRNKFAIYMMQRANNFAPAWHLSLSWRQGKNQYDVICIQAPTKPKRRRAPSRRTLVRLAIPAYETHCWAKKRQPHNGDCAYANEFPVLAVDPDVIISRTCATYNSIRF
jgi:hypothetical protein